MSITEKFLLALLVIYTLPWLVWRLGRTDYYAPLAVVQIVCGIVLGPGVAGAAFPDLFAFVFAPQVMTALNGISWWAVILFVWAAGVELDLRAAWDNRRETGIAAGLALVMPLFAGSLAALALLAWGGPWVGSVGREWQFVIAIGMACAVTAMPILILLMERLEILRQPLGQRILRYASLDDIAVWAVLAFVLLDWERLERQAVFLLLFPLACRPYHAVMKKLLPADRWFAALAWLIACSLMADSSGLHFMVGAFLAGAVTHAEWFDREEVDRFRGAVLSLLMPVFFLSTGLRTNWAMGGLAMFGSALLLLAAAVFGKLAGAHLAGRLLGWKAGEAAIIGWLLQTKALIMIIFVNILLDKDIITDQAFTALLVMAVASTMLTVPMVLTRLTRKAERRGDSFD
jgi:Kef-type K+ transport system membrane component KefB